MAPRPVSQTGSCSPGPGARSAFLEGAGGNGPRGLCLEGSLRLRSTASPPSARGPVPESLRAPSRGSPVPAPLKHLFLALETGVLVRGPASVTDSVTLGR